MYLCYELAKITIILKIEFYCCLQKKFFSKRNIDKVDELSVTFGQFTELKNPHFLLEYRFLANPTRLLDKGNSYKLSP